MVNIKFLEQVAKEQIDHPGHLQIEYQHNNIILVNTFLDELYNELYNANDGDAAAIMELLSTEKIKARTNWKPIMDLDKGLTECVENYTKN